MFNLPDIAIGAIIAALIASLFSFLGMIMSKEQKTSEFRQAWIDSLRLELSRFISAANSIHTSTVRETANDDADRLRPTISHLASLDEAAATIRLRLNSDEDPSKKVLAEIKEIKEIFKKMHSIDYEKLEASEDRLIREASILLKFEWDRVKRGELIYRIAKWGVFFATLIFLALAGFSFFGGNHADAFSNAVEHHDERDTREHAE